MKYVHLLNALDDFALYTAASIAAFADNHGFLDAEDPETRRLEKQRLRIAMGRRRSFRAFPDTGDGLFKEAGQPHTAAWFGWRWKGGQA